MVAVDAGVHLGAIANILEQTQPDGLGGAVALPHTLASGPFAGLELPYASARANAAHLSRDILDTYLVTHPHLDHISGFVINTASQPGTRSKRLVALPSTIHAFKTHIFNNVIWPNLSDENNGAGLVTYIRLVEGGSPALGEGPTKGYLDVTDSLAVKVWSISHGHCIEKHSHRGSVSTSAAASHRGRSLVRPASQVPSPSLPPRSRHSSVYPEGGLQLQLPAPAAATTATTATTATAPTASPPAVPAASLMPTHTGVLPSISGGSAFNSERICVYESSAYFLREAVTGREVLIFGDVEPDSISLSPRNAIVWQEAAHRIVAGTLAAIIIECSFDNNQTIDRLYGHLKPNLLMEELWALGCKVDNVRKGESEPVTDLPPPPQKKRKLDVVAGRHDNDDDDDDEDDGNDNDDNDTGCSPRWCKSPTRATVRGSSCSTR